MKTLERKRDLTPDAWKALAAVYEAWFARDLYVNFPEMWECLPSRGFVMASLDCEAALEVIEAIKTHRAAEQAALRVLPWYLETP